MLKANIRIQINPESFELLEGWAQALGNEVRGILSGVAAQMKPIVAAYIDLEKAVIELCLVTNEHPQKVSEEAVARVYDMALTTAFSVPQAAESVAAQLRGRAYAARMGIVGTHDLDPHQLTALLLFAQARQAGKADTVASIAPGQNKTKAWRDSLGQGRGKRKL